MSSHEERDKCEWGQEEKIREERKEKEKEKEKKGRENEERKEDLKASSSTLSAFRRSEFAWPRVKVHLLDEGYVPRV